MQMSPRRLVAAAATVIGSLALTLALAAAPGQSASGQPPAAAKDKKDKKQEQFQIAVKPGPPAPEKSAEAKPADAEKSESAEKPAEKSEKKDDSLPDFRKGPLNPWPGALPPYDRLNETGTLPASVFHDGGTYLPPEQRVPEVFQHFDPREQIKQGQLLGSQLPPVVLEYKILTKEVKPGDEVRAVARLSAVNKPRPFSSLFTHLEYGRSRAAVYLNFEPTKKDPNTFLGRGALPKYVAPGRYIIGDTIIGDENGHRKAYWPDWNPVLQEPDGSPIGFVVTDNVNADITPPTLKKLELVEKRAKVGDNIHLNVWLEDDKSGPSEVQAYWISPSHAQSLRADLVQVQNQPGLFKSSFQIPEWYEGGDWTLLSLKISDKATNEKNLFAVSVPMLQQITVNIEQDPAKVDKEPPRLLALQLSHDELPRDKELSITLLAEDDLSGVKEAYVSFLSPYGADFNRVTLTNDSPNLRRRSAGQQVNVFRGTLKLKPTQEPGKWIVSRVNLGDNANNYRNYNPRRDRIVSALNVLFTDPRMKTKTTTEEQK